MKNSVQKLQHQKLTCVHCGQTYHTPRELAGHIRSQHADTLPSRTAPPKAKQEEKGSRVPVSVAVPSSGAQEHLQRALEGLSQRHRQIDEELARQETLQAEKEAIGKQIGALKLALQAFVGMSGVGSGSQLDIAVAESPELKTSPPASTVVKKPVGGKPSPRRRRRSKRRLQAGPRLQAMERIIQQLGMRPTTRQMAQLLGREGFAVSHVQVFKDYRTLKNKS
jgi:hypothetical protein